MAKEARKRIGPKTEAQLLVECRRRCCLCVFLEGNTNVRSGQVAHIDNNPANNNMDNLVWLCLEHHNQYDSRTSQSKNITIAELKHYKEKLVEVVNKNDTQQIFASPIGTQAVEYSSSGYLIGSILEAYDRELSNHERNIKPNGIKLKNLAKAAAVEEGDFFAAHQAFLSLLRLGGECERKGNQRAGISEPVRTATVVSAAEDVLECFAFTDFSLFIGALHEGREIAVKGDSSFFEFDPTLNGPSPSFFTFGQILCRLGRRSFAPNNQAISKLFGNALGELALSAAMLLAAQGLPLPTPPGIIYIRCDGERVAPENEDKRLEPFIWAANRIAHLPDQVYQAALDSMKFCMAVGDVSEDKKQGYSAETAISLLEKWMVLPGRAIIFVSLKSKNDIDSVKDHIQEFKERGSEVAKAAHAFVVKERELVMRPKTIRP